jgi:hypothetical protein
MSAGCATRLSRWTISDSATRSAAVPAALSLRGRRDSALATVGAIAMDE